MNVTTLFFISYINIFFFLILMIGERNHVFLRQVFHCILKDCVIITNYRWIQL